MIWRFILIWVSGFAVFAVADVQAFSWRWFALIVATVAVVISAMEYERHRRNP